MLSLHRKAGTFLLGEVMPLAEAEYGASPKAGDRLLLGFSDGASWAVATGLRHPGLFGRVAGLSLGWPEVGRPPATGARPRLFLAAGASEGVFEQRTRAFASSARSAGYNVKLEIRPGEHGQALWRKLYPEILEWAFGRKL